MTPGDAARLLDPRGSHPQPRRQAYISGSFTTVTPLCPGLIPFKPFRVSLNNSRFQLVLYPRPREFVLPISFANDYDDDDDDHRARLSRRCVTTFVVHARDIIIANSFTKLRSESTTHGTSAVSTSDIAPIELLLNLSVRVSSYLYVIYLTFFCNFFIGSFVDIVTSTTSYHRKLYCVFLINIIIIIIMIIDYLLIILCPLLYSLEQSKIRNRKVVEQ